MALASSAASNLQLSVNVGGDVAEITTEKLGFAAIGHGLEGPPKLKLLPTPWPNDNLPPACATLLSVASRRGLVAAAGPDALVITSTGKAREALKTKTKTKQGDKDVISDFEPDLTIPVPRLRHVAFTVDEEYLVLNKEGGAGFFVHDVDTLLKGITKPGLELSVHDEGVRALLPCPDPNMAHYMAVIGDTGRLTIVDISSGKSTTIDTKGKSVTCGSWSARGKAYVVGFEDGTAAAYQVTETLLGTIPRPPDVEESYSVSSISFLSNDDFFMVHSPPEAEAEQDSIFHFVKTKYLKNETPKFKQFTFHKSESPMVWPYREGDAPARSYPPRYSVSRLKAWEPIMNDMLILAGAYSTDIVVLTNTKEPISLDQEAVNEYQIAYFDDHRKAAVPRQSFGEDLDSVLIGEALDLSSTEIVERPSKRLEELDKSPTPVPAYFILTHEGLLQAYWVMWDQSLLQGTAYPGLTALNGTAKPSSIVSRPGAATETEKPSLGTSSAQTSSPFGLGTLSTPKPGATSTQVFGAPPAAKPAQATFGTSGFASTSMPKPTPVFGTTTFGASTTAKPATFGTPGFAGTPTATSTPVFGTPTFGASTTTKPAQATFGTASFGGRPSSASPFVSAAGGQNGFAGFANKTPASASGFSDFAKDNSASSSGFGGFAGSGGGFTGLGKQNSSFSAFSGSKDPSFTSNGSTLSSFGSIGSNTGDVSDAKNRERDEATPTPLDFKLGTTFLADGISKEDGRKPVASGGSMFGENFISGITTKPPATPEKNVHKVSTTPATQPKQPNLFAGLSSSKDIPTPQALTKEPVVPEEAPLPPDPITYRAPKLDDDLPPIAGSPPVQIDAPSSSIPSSPLEDDDEEGEVSDEEEEDEESGGETGDETGEPSPSDAARRARSSQSNHQSPPIYPAAPTPPPTVAQQFKQVSTPYGEPTKASPLQFGQTVTSASRTQSNLSGIRREPLPGSGLSLSASIQQQFRPPQPELEVADLIDDEDDRIRRELESNIEPSRTLDDFIARQEHTGAARGKTGHVAQIEILYRDINNMVDTLGLNWRSLKAFVDYNGRSQRYTELTLEALEEVNQQGQDGPWFEKWCLVETEDLMKLEKELAQGLDDGRVQNFVDKLSQLTRLLRAKASLSTKINDVRRQIINRKDPERLEAVRRASLPKELADQQKALRSEYARLLTQLSQAEEAVMLLKSKLVSRQAQNGRTGAVPTVERIKKTINSFIEQTEMRMTKVALLESQFRKIALADSSHTNSSSSRQAGTPARRNRGLRNGSPFATPPTNRSRMSLSELNRRALTPDVEETTPTEGYGLFYTPEGTPSADKTLAKLGDMDVEDLAKLRGKARRRRKIAAGLESALIERGVKQTRVAH